MEFRFVQLRHLEIEDGRKVGTLFSIQFRLVGILFHDKAVDDVGIHAGETALFKLAFQHGDDGSVQLPVEQQYAVAFVLGCFDVAVLGFLVLGIQVNQITVLVRLIVLDELLVFFEREVFTVTILKEGEVLGLVVEVVLCQHTVVDEDLDVVPFLLEFLAVVLEQALQAVAHFLRDVAGNLLHVAVALQVAAADVQRDVR